MKRIALITTSLALASCIQEVPSKVDLDKLTSMKVEIATGQVGTKESPLPFDPAGAPFTLQVTALNGRGEVKQDFQGPIKLSSQPGLIDSPSINFNNGEGSVNLTLEKAFGVTRIWVEDPVTFATGVSEPIYYRGPKIPDVQASTTTIASPFEGSRVPIDDTTELVVVGIARDGFYITDVNATEWKSIYAFTFSAPAGLSVGDRVTNVSGRIAEFLGFTELNNPAWEVVGNSQVPNPVPVTCTELDTNPPNLPMEKLESSLIEVTNATIEICPAFPNCPDYDEFRQWTVNLGGCSINVVTRYTVAGFFPDTNEGEAIPRMTGTLRHIQFADPEWILEPRDAGDVCCPTCTPALNAGC